MGVPSSSFIDTYNEKVTDLMVKLVEYVQAMDKTLLNTSNFSVGTGTGLGADTGADDLPRTFTVEKSIVLGKDVNGFPILPDPIPSDGWKKTNWDSLFTDYLSQQYHLACGGIKRHIPYKQISEKQQDFIDKKYLPRKTMFRPPRNITLDEMKTIFEHFLQSQRSNGPENTFKFKSIKLKGKTVSANYKILDDSDASETRHIPSLVSTILPSAIGTGSGTGTGPVIDPVPVATTAVPDPAGSETIPTLQVSSDPTVYPTPPPTNTRKTRPKPRQINKKKT